MLQTLTTPRGEALFGTPWQIYPRPQMRRDSYINLNGEWDFAVSSEKPATFDTVSYTHLTLPTICSV